MVLEAATVEPTYLVEEPGIVRTPTGRITATDWPSIPHCQWPSAYREIGKFISEQIQLELSLKNGALRVGDAYETESMLFKLESRTAYQPLLEVFNEKVKKEDLEQFNLLEIGGARETIFKTVFEAQREIKRENLWVVRTTLVHHEKKPQRDFADQIRTMAIELPHNGFYKKFDIICAQNSVYHWSKFPELATLNLYKMLKEDGVVIATVPDRPRYVFGEERFYFNDYFEKQDLFKYEKYHYPRFVIRLTKKI